MQRCDTQLCNSEGRVIYRFQASRNLGSSRFNKCWYHILPPVEFTQLSLLVNIIHLHFYFWRKWKYFCVKYRCLCDFCFWCRKSVVAKILGTVVIVLSWYCYYSKNYITYQKNLRSVYRVPTGFNLRSPTQRW